MPSLSKIQSGFMYKEDFDNSGVVWQSFPQTDKFIADGTCFKIEQGDERVTIVTSIPDENFIMQVKINHQPLSFNNLAGVVVIKDNESWVECQSYRHPENELTVLKTYQYIKVIKKFDNFIFYASVNGNQWELIGSTKVFDANLIGFFFESDEALSNFIIEDIQFYKTNLISFLGLEPLTKIIIKRPSGINRLFHVVKTENRVDIDLIEDLMPYKNHTIQVINPSGVILVNMPIEEINGGDVFDVSYKLEMRLNETLNHAGTILEPGQTFDLGKLKASYMNHTLTLRNLDNGYIARQIKVKVEKFSNYTRGSDFVELALPDENGLHTIWEKEITVDRLDYNVPVTIGMKINKDTSSSAVFTEAKHKYRIIVE